MDRIKSFNEFQPLALRTESRINSVKTNKKMLQALLSIQIASAEILDGIKKSCYYDNNKKLLENTEDRLNDIATALLILRDIELSPDSLEDEIPVPPRVFHGVLGAISEIGGEVSEILLDGINGKGIDRTSIMEEFSDCAWYQAILNDALELDYYQGLTNVISKLSLRYPEKFTTENASNRNLDAERKALEVGVVEPDTRKKYNESTSIHA